MCKRMFGMFNFHHLQRNSVTYWEKGSKTLNCDIIENSQLKTNTYQTYFRLFYQAVIIIIIIITFYKKNHVTVKNMYSTLDITRFQVRLRRQT